jgi:hypothetical protein
VLPTQPHREELIGIVDTWHLRQLRWPILRLFARRFVEQRELEHYVQMLLASGRWSSVHTIPSTRDSARSPHIFEVYGTSN